MVNRQIGVDGKRGGGGDGDQHVPGNAVIEVVVVEDALKAFGVGTVVLPLERGERAGQGWRHDKAARAPVCSKLRRGAGRAR